MGEVPPPVRCELRTADILFSAAPPCDVEGGAGAAPLRVVETGDGWVALDNRRLAACVIAQQPTVAVDVVPLSDPAARRELRELRELRPGAPRAASRGERTEHYEAQRGAYAFQRCVLGWDPGGAGGGGDLGPHAVPPAPAAAASLASLAAAHEPCVLAEARAQVRAALTQPDAQPRFDLALVSVQRPRRPPPSRRARWCDRNPDVAHFAVRRWPPGTHVRPADAFLLVDAAGGARCLALACTHAPAGSDTLAVKVADASVGRAGRAAGWRAYLLASLLSLQRMYDAVLHFQHGA
eukprot:gene2796-1191_t